MGDTLKKYKMIIQYEGTRYQGWQKQITTENTLQGKLETLLSRMEQRKVEVQGAGRTDSGVHAYGQVISVELASGRKADEIRDAINQYLPEDIAVLSVEEVSERFHARLNAVSKVYRYRVLNSCIPNVFERKYVYVVSDELDLKAMEQAALYLCGKHDFQAFCTKKKSKKSTERCISKIDIERVCDEVRFTYEGNGFLYHMVRILTGTLLEVGLGKRKAEDIPNILESKNRAEAGFLVPGCGLALMSVKYNS